MRPVLAAETDFLVESDDMKNCLIAMAAAVAAAGAFGTVDNMIGNQAQNEGISVVPAKSAPVIDGAFAPGEWDFSGQIWSFADWDVKEQFSVKTACMWDKDYIYMAFDWRDPLPLNSAVNPKDDPSHGWTADAVQLRVKTPRSLAWITVWGYDKGRRPAFHIALAGDGERMGQKTVKDKQLLLYPDKPGVADMGEGVQLAYRMADDGKGFTQELRMPWTLLYNEDAHVAQAEDKFRMGVEFYWAGPTGCGWPYHSYKDNLQPGVTTRMFFWTATQVWGDVKLEKGPVAKRVYRPQTLKPEGTIPVRALVPSDREFFTVAIDDKDGNRVNGGLTVAPGNSSGNYVQACTIGEGQVAFDASMMVRHIGNNGIAGLANCFDGNFSGAAGQYAINNNYNNQGDPCKVKPGDPSTWVRIVMHLEEGKGPATHFDLQGLGSSQLNYLPTQFSLEGSIDGQKWTEVYSNIYAYDADWTTSEQYNFWLSDTTKTGNAHATLAYDEGYFYNLSETGALPFEAYKWFRLSFAQIGTPPDYTYHGVSLRQIGLYSEDGARQNVGLKVVNGITTTGGIVQSALIGKGEAGYDVRMAGTRITFDSGYSDISGSFIEDGYSGDKGKCIFRHLTSDYKNIVPDPYDESTWISVIMHLEDEAKPITHFDVETLDWNNKSVPTRVRLEASLDGMTWDEVWSNVDDGYEPIDWGEEGVRYNRWMSDPTKVAAAHATLPYSADYPLNTWSTGGEKGADEDWFDQFYYTEGFGVANGATLAATAPFDLDRLIVDASKTNGGTLEGFNIVQGGQITVRNLPQMGAVIDLPMLGEGCTGEGFEDWNVVGADPEKYSVLIKNGQLKINSNQSGMVILIK